MAKEGFFGVLFRENADNRQLASPSVCPTSLRFSGEVPPRAEARTREFYAELGAEAPRQRTALSPLQARVGQRISNYVAAQK
jgi:hypothetical protein